MGSEMCIRDSNISGFKPCPSQIFFQLGVFVAVTGKKGLWKIKIDAIYAFPEQNHIIAFKDPQNWYFSQKTPVAQG